MHLFVCLAVRPTMPETTALGAAMAAGMAKGVEVWTVQAEDKSQINTDIFEPAVDTHGKMIFRLPVSFVSVHWTIYNGHKLKTLLIL